MEFEQIIIGLKLVINGYLNRAYAANRRIFKQPGNPKMSPTGEKIQSESRANIQEQQLLI